MPITEGKTRPVRVWDAPVRLFHWLLVALLGFSWWSGERHLMDWHRLSGEAILALLIFRIYWGFAGGGAARFARFVRGPRAVAAYLGSLSTKPYRSGLTHNPAGGWSVVAMLAALIAMVVAGLFAVDVDGLESGPLADYVAFETGRLAARAHGLIFDLLLVLVALHVLAIGFYLLRFRDNLVGPMITGRRHVPADEVAEPLPAPLWRLAAGIALAGLCAYAVARGFR